MVWSASPHVTGWDLGQAFVIDSSAGPTGDVLLVRGEANYGLFAECGMLAQFDGLGGFTQMVASACAGSLEPVNLGVVDRKDDVLYATSYIINFPNSAWSFGRAGPGGFGASGTSPPGTRVGVGFMGTDAAGTTLVGCSVSSGGWNFGGGLQSGSLLVAYDAFGQYAGSIPDPGVQHIDDAGNLYLSKVLQGTTDVGCGPVTGAAGGSTLFAKLDPTGACLWSKALGVTGATYTVDAAGESLIAARFSGTLSLGGPPLTSAGTTDLAVAKLDTAGNHLWSRSFGAAGATLSAPTGSRDEIATDLAGSLITHGRFKGTVDFGSGPVTAGAAGQDFILKLAPGGALGWAKTFVSGDYLSVTAAGDGSVIVSASSLYPGIDLGCGPVTGNPVLIKLAP